MQKHNQLQGSIREKLAPVRGQIKTRRADSIKDPAPSPARWKQDGEDHINIWERGATDIGRFLTHNSNFHFTHNLFGRFANMECFWHYIQSDERDDRVRTLTGQQLKNFAKKMTQIRVQNFRAIIMDSNYQRIMKYPAVVQSMRDTTLPFDCYYVDKATKLRTRPSFFNWFVMGMEEIRSAIKDNRSPNFNFLLDKPGSSIYEYVLPKREEEPAPRVEKAEKTEERGSLLTPQASAADTIPAAAEPVPEPIVPEEDIVVPVESSSDLAHDVIQQASEAEQVPFVEPVNTNPGSITDIVV